MNFHLVKIELRRLGKKKLFNMLMNQGESRCLLKGLCSFRFVYKGYAFCISEVLGGGCEFQKLKKLEQEAYEIEKGLSEERDEIPLFDCMKDASYNFE